MEDSTKKFWQACLYSNLATAQELAFGVDLNRPIMQDPCVTGLHVLCQHASPEIVKFLISLPHLDVNIRGLTKGNTLSVLNVLTKGQSHETLAGIVQHPRMLASLVDDEDDTPLTAACSWDMFHGDDGAPLPATSSQALLHNVKVLIMSGKDLNHHHKALGWRDRSMSALEIAEQQNCEGLTELLREYYRDPADTTRKLRLIHRQSQPSSWLPRPIK